MFDTFKMFPVLRKDRTSVLCRLFGLLLLLGLLLGLLSAPGCSSVPEKQDFVTINVPVPVKCKPPTLQKPSMPFDELAKKGGTTFDKTKMLIAQDLRQRAYIFTLEAALTSCTTGAFDSQTGATPEVTGPLTAPLSSFLKELEDGQ
jgi:hypothetical protein